METYQAGHLPREQAQGVSTWNLGPLLRAKPLGTYNRSIRESRTVEGLRSKLSPKELHKVCMGLLIWETRRYITT